MFAHLLGTLPGPAGFPRERMHDVTDVSELTGGDDGRTRRPRATGDPTPTIAGNHDRPSCHDAATDRKPLRMLEHAIGPVDVDADAAFCGPRRSRGSSECSATPRGCACWRPCWRASTRSPSSRRSSVRRGAGSRTIWRASKWRRYVESEPRGGNVVPGERPSREGADRPADRRVGQRPFAAGIRARDLGANVALPRDRPASFGRWPGAHVRCARAYSRGDETPCRGVAWMATHFRPRRTMRPRDPHEDRPRSW